jgi:hypothetical protein
LKHEHRLDQPSFSRAHSSIGSSLSGRSDLASS